MMKDDEGILDFVLLGGFALGRTDKWMNRQTECECRVAFATEKLIKNCLFVCKHLNIVFVTKN